MSMNKVQPSRKAWIDACQQAIDEELRPLGQHKLKLEWVMSERKHRRLARVRWRAFAIMLERNPNYSIAGIGRVSDRDHTTVLFGLKKFYASKTLTPVLQSPTLEA